MRHVASWISIVSLLGCAGLALAQDRGIAPAVDGAGGQPEPMLDPALAKPGPMPLSQELGIKLDVIPGIRLAPADNDALWQQDQADKAAGRGTGIKRISIERPIDFDWNAGAWYEVPHHLGGGRLWVLDIVSPNAWGVRTHFKDFDLPTGARMTVYSPTDVSGAPWPYEGRGRRGTGEFWARTAFGDTARVEVYVPAEAGLDPAQPLFTIDAIHHWYINMLTGTPSAFSTNELSCHRDVTCEAWANEARGVCMIYMNGGACSASILNTFASDWTPYMYTAAHCFNTQAGADSLETYWFFQTSTCNGTIPSIPTGINRADDAILLSTGTAADHTLVMIEGTIRRDLWWQGWDPNAFGTGNDAFGIHHPGGTYKRWSSGTTSTTGVGCAIAGIGPGVTGLWSTGTTEPGSSGSALFDSARRVRGALSCANATCTAGSRRFYYGPFSVAQPNFAALLNGGSDDASDTGSGNDTCATATVLTTGAGVGGLANRIVKSVDEDFYSFVVPAGGTISVSTTFTHAYGDIDLQLLDNCGAVLASSTTTSSSETVNWSNTGATNRTVQARVFLFNDTRNQYNIGWSVVGAPIPTNDSCGSALTLTNAVTLSGTNVGASTDGSASCGFNTTNDVWYRFTPPCSTTLTINTLGSNFDTVLSAYTGACPGTTSTQIACNDDFSGLQSQISFFASQGTPYLIRVAGYNGALGNISITANLSGPFNDSCTSPVPLGAGSYTFNNCGTTTDGPTEALCGSFAGTVFFNDFWNTFSAPSDGVLTVDTFGSSMDTMLALYANTCPAGPDTALACNDDFLGLQSQVFATIFAGQTIYIRTGGYNGAIGSGNLTIAFSPTGGSCDSIDFNNDGLFPDDADLIDLLSVLAGGPCSNDPFCNDIDFNNDGLFPDDSDLISFLAVLAGGSC